MCEKIIYLSSLNKNSFEELSQSSLQLAKDEFDANDKSKTFIKYIVGE
ncbi:hypothetical protein [Photobacterium phosphoreum]